MKLNKRLVSASLAAVLISACTYDFPVKEAPSFGSADFSKIVSVGDSWTAGFMDNAHYTAAQNNSFPAVIARQAVLIGGSATFNQPSVNSPNGCSNPTGGCTQGRLIFKNPAAPAPAPTTGDNGASLALFTSVAKNLINNWGVPNVTLQTAQIAAAGGPAPPAPNPAYNPYYRRVASNPSVDGVTGSTLIGDAAASLTNGGSFFTFWLGNNDVLGYATGGASNPAILTSSADFQTRFNSALNAMLNAKADAEGAVANIPNVTSIPFFTTVVFNPVVFLSSNPTQVATVNSLNGPAAYGGFNAALDGLVGASVISQDEANKRKVVFRHGTNAANGSNALVITDESLADLSVPLGNINPALASFGRVRQATSADLVTLPAGSVIPLGQGVSTPLGDSFVLIPAEQTEIQNSINNFNTTIADAVQAQSARLVLVDMNKVLADLRLGTIDPTKVVTINGSNITATITPPFGGFSADGVHPNQRGAGYTANQFILAINAKWGAGIPLCNPNDLPGNALPIP